jgi:alpha-1,4-N-acetylglucosaminyltransferase EXTL2
VSSHQRYNLILTGASFFHRKYMAEYWQLPTEMLQYIERVFNCEDLALNFLIADRTNQPPLWVDAPYRRMSQSGLFQQGGHFNKRSACLGEFVNILGRNPLHSNDHFVRAIQKKT